MGTQVKRGKGRQKLEMAKIANKSHLNVTFSKRRAGIFKKASELATLCGAEVGLIVFSPGKKAFSFGHPDIDAIANKFSHLNVADSRGMEENLRGERMQGLILELEEVERQQKTEQQCADTFDRYKKQHKPPIDELDYQQLCVLQDALQRLKKVIDGKMHTAVDNHFGPLIPYTFQKYH